MKIKSLTLKAYGPFTDREPLNFELEKPGLHIIYGHNEAGKSSSLRALKALLYGFPERTVDNFQHPNPQLLVRGVIEGQNGKSLIFDRRKKRKGDLLDVDGNPIDSSELSSFLAGVDQKVFESLYCIDHKTLVAGGEDILAQKGEVGTALFSAGTGISSLRKILEWLESEAELLFKNQGSNPEINKAIKEYKEYRKMVKDAVLLPSEWKTHKNALLSAEKIHTSLDEESRALSVEIQRLTRLRRVIPALAELINLEQQLSNLGDVVVLPPDFSIQLTDIKQKIHEEGLKETGCGKSLDKLRKEQADISLNQSILDNAESIGDLHQRLDRYRKDKSDLNILKQDISGNQKIVETLLENINPKLDLKTVETLRPVLGKEKTIQELSVQYATLQTDISNADEQLMTAEAEKKELETKLGNLSAYRDSSGLKKTVVLVRKVGDIDVQVNDLSHDINSEKEICQKELKRQSLWTGEMSQLPELALPLKETLNRYNSKYEAIELENIQFGKDLVKLESELGKAKEEWKEVEYAGEVPSEEELEKVRTERQKGWAILRRKWIDNEDVSQEAKEYNNDQPVHSAYESKVEQADTVADRLRREAERVARAASIRAEMGSLKENIEDLNRKIEQSVYQKNAFDTEWKREWESLSISPLSPKEMSSWQVDIEKLRYKVEEISKKESELSDKTKQRKNCKISLIKELKFLGENTTYSDEDLAPVLICAEEVLEAIDKQIVKAESLKDKADTNKKDLEKAKGKKQRVEATQKKWQINWGDILKYLELNEDISPSEAVDLCSNIRSCLVKVDKVMELQIRIDGLEKDINQFISDVTTTTEKVDADLAGFQPDQAVLKLTTILSEAQKNEERLNTIKEELDKISLSKKEASETLSTLHKELDERVNIAGCENSEDLNNAIIRSNDYQRLKTSISSAEAALANICDGIPIEDIRIQVDNVDPDDLPGQIETMTTKKDNDLTPKIQEALKQIGEEQTMLQLMDGSSKAAEAAEKQEEVSTRLKRLVEQYIKFKLAARILNDEIERYREEHQDPVLKLASSIFSGLTLDSFSSLKADFDDNGNPVLAGIRPNGDRVVVEGMSDGTCDQLYLALRMATIELFLKTREPIPFIVDDILINFDDDRSKATLNELGNLAEKNQVILFTHHKKIVEEAKNLKKKGIVQIHEI